MNICTFGSSDKKAAAAATSRTRRSLLRVGFLLLFVLVFRFSTVQVLNTSGVFINSILIDGDLFVKVFVERLGLVRLQQINI